MKYSVLSWVCVFALVALPVGGCGDHITIINIGTGGTEGSGGSGGDMGDVFPCTEQGIRDAIAEGGGPQTFACDGPTTVVTEATIVIDNDVILDGEGNLTVDGNDDHRVFSVAEGMTAELRGFTVSGGQCTEEQRAMGRLKAHISFVCIGSAIKNSGTLTLTGSTLSNNRGVALLNEATMTMANSTMSNPEGAPDGVHSPGTLTIVNSTIDDMIQNFGVLRVMQSTVDRVDSQFEDSVTIANSLVAECVDAEQPSSAGYNIESPGDTCGFDPDGTDQVDVTEGELNLGPLQDNGGPTMTHALLPGSIAIDVIPADMCEVDEDQRGEPRPGGTMCDVGAFEVQP